MAKQTIDLGTLGGADGTGDSIRTAGAKINSNFDELYATSAVQSHIGMSQNEITSTQSNADIVLKPAGTGSISFPAIKFNDNHIETVRTNDDINVVPSGTGSVIVNALKLNDNVISTFESNADIEFKPSGTGGVDATAITIDNTINMSDNTIKILSDTSSNVNLNLNASGSGSIQTSKIDINGGELDGTPIGANSAAAGTFTTLAFDIADGGRLSTTGGDGGVALLITGNEITTSQSNENLELEASGTGYVSINGLSLPHTDGATGQVIKTDGSGQLDWFTSPILLGVSDIQDAKTTISFAGQTVIDHVTATGDHHRVESGTSVLDSFVTSKYDSAWYLAVNRDDNSTEFEAVKHSLVHNGTDAFVSSSVGTKTGTNNHIITSADVSSGLARLLGIGSSTFNSMAYYRIGLGDDDSTGYAGEDEAAVVINTDVDSASEVIDSWAHASFRGAKYYVSVNNASKTELMNCEVTVVHNGTNAFVSTYNIVNTGNNDLCTFTAALNGSNLELSAAGLETNLRVHAYRIRLADNEADRSSTNINVIGNVTVSSATTTLDTFDTGSYQAAHYVIVSHNASEGHSAICEAAVVSDGTNAFVSQYGLTSSKGTDQILLTVGHAGTTTTLSATSTSGGSTTVNAYRVNLTRGPGTATASATLDSVSATTYRGAKYNVQVVDTAGGNFEVFEVNVVHDGSTAYLSTFGNTGNNIDLITMSADINSGNLRLRGTINNTNDHVVTVVRRIITA